MSTATQHNSDLISNKESSDNESHLTSARVAMKNISSPLQDVCCSNISRSYDSNELSVLERFTSFAALHDSYAQGRNRICFPGTREHVLKSIQRWIDNPSAERILWFHGPFGAGKSAIAQTVARENRRDKVAATFFFFRSDPSRNDGTSLVATLAWQLAFSIPAIKSHISHALYEYPDLPRRDVEIQFEELIFRPLLALDEYTVQQQAPVIIIDGIDACLNESLQQRFLEVIGTAIKNSHFPLRFLISSRPETHIEETICHFESPICRINLANLNNANRDIERYLHTEFTRIAAKKGLDPTWPSRKTIRGLALRSAGQFLYASFVIRLVGDADNDAKTQLDIILQLKPPHTPSPFAVLDQLYFEILNRVPDQDFLKKFLCLLVGRCSIPIDNLSNDDAMLMDISTVELGKRLHQMHSILKFEPCIDVHYSSFLEFLQDSSRSSQYHVSKNNGTRRYLELVTKLLIGRAARLTTHPDFHGVGHFAPGFGKLVTYNLQVIKLETEDWEQILRPLLNVLDKLLAPSNIYSLKDGYCRQCQFFQITYDTLTHFKSLLEIEDQDIEKCLKSLEDIIKYGDSRRQNFDIGLSLVVFGSAAIVGILMAIRDSCV